MEECPFLSTYENDVECFKECALYNYKENGGKCPFKNLAGYTINKRNISFLEDIESDIELIGDYFVRQKQYS